MRTLEQSSIMEVKSSVKSDSLKPEMGLVSKHRRKKTVRWGDLIVYEFPNILGDNPAVSDAGAPLTIAWTHESVNVFTVDYNEFLRQKRPRRRRKDLIITGAQRDTVSLYHWKFHSGCKQNYFFTNVFILNFSFSIY